MQLSSILEGEAWCGIFGKTCFETLSEALHRGEWVAARPERYDKDDWQETMLSSNQWGCVAPDMCTLYQVNQFFWAVIFP